VIDLPRRGVGDSFVAIETSAVLSFPETRTDLRSLQAIHPEQERLWPRILESVQLCHHSQLPDLLGTEMMSSG
jgi:hypothetical protein